MSKVKTRNLPFTPKSNATLLPGDFWGFKFAPGRYGAGRILELPWQYGIKDRTGFLAALMDWHGPRIPTSDDLESRGILDQGTMGIRAFSFSNWTIDGNRDLALDHLEPALCKTATYTQWVRKGLQQKRLGTPYELETCPVESTWGMTVIIERAKKHFGKAKP